VTELVDRAESQMTSCGHTTVVSSGGCLKMRCTWAWSKWTSHQSVAGGVEVDEASESVGGASGQRIWRLREVWKWTRPVKVWVEQVASASGGCGRCGSGRGQ
jgi:hypothetical protein